MQIYPEFITSAVGNIAKKLDTNENRVVELILTDWLAKNQVELALFGTRLSSSAFDFESEDLQELYQAVGAEYTARLLADEKLAGRHYDHIKQVREQLNLQSARLSDTYIGALQQAIEADQLTDAEVDAELKELQRRGTDTSWTANINPEDME